MIKNSYKIKIYKNLSNKDFIKLFLYFNYLGIIHI